MTTCSMMRGREELEQAFSKISQSWSLDGAHLELSSAVRNDEIAAFLVGNFFPDEPLSKSLRLADDFKEFDSLKGALKGNLSVLLVTDSTDEIIGVQVINMTWKNVEPAKMANKKLAMIFNFFGHKDEEMDVFRHFGVDVAAHFDMLCVHRDFRKKGYAFILVQAALAFSRELGYDRVGIMAEGSSNFSKRVFEKCGLETLREMMYAEYEVDDEVVFTNTGEHKSTKVYVKELCNTH